ncbi:MAG TPA: nuclear transport factor 2 family protein [Terriglobales bacterium]|jgi:hypothetical protein|nr:nuclear transport factor 2 family protein [Terriglobales bacterium]
MLRLVSLLAALSALSLALSAQTAGGMPTLEAARFTRLEQRLSQAVAQRDLPALHTLLADDFELRDAANSSELVLRDEWLDLVSGGTASAACAPAEVMPRPFGDTAAVSLVCTAGAERYFLVDLWRRQGSEWRLAARYRSPAPPAAAETHTKH